MNEAANNLELLERTFQAMLKTGGQLGPSQLRPLILNLIALKILADDLASRDEAPNRFADPDDEHDDRARFEWTGPRSMVYGRVDDVMALAEDVEEALPWAREVFTTLLLRDLDQLAAPVLSDWLYWIGKLSFARSGGLDRAAVLRWFDDKLDEDTTGWASGENGTPRSIARLMVKLAKLKKDDRVLDPRAGNGAILVEAAEALARLSDNPEGGEPQVFGQEPRRVHWAWAVMRLALANRPSDQIVCQDSLSAPAFVERGQLSRFGAVLCDVPFTTRHPSGVELREPDPYGRFDRTTYERPSPENAYIQHALASLDDEGRAVLLVTPGFLYRQGQAERLRRKLLQQRLVKAVIGLPPKMYWPQTAIEAALVVLDRGHASGETDRGVTFVDAAQITPKTRGRMVLGDDLIDRIVASALDASAGAPHGMTSQRVSTEDLLKQQDASLKPGHHARPREEERDPAEKLVRAQDALEYANRRYQEASEKFDALLRRLTDDERQKPN
jgi:type I restriction enzyme M protein